MESRSGIYPVPIALKVSFGIIMVPVEAVISIKAPLYISHPAKEETKAGIPSEATGSPVKKPANPPKTIALTIVSHTGKWNLVSKTAATAPKKPDRNPTDRSICLMIITKVIPVARTAI